MIGATAKAEQFYSRTGSESTKGSRKGFSLIGGGENPLAHLTPEERRDSLKQKLKGLNAELVLVKKGRDKRRLLQLGQEIAQTCSEINQLRPKRISGVEVTDHFIDICRETMTKPQFSAIMDEANRRLRAAKDGA
jgi:hypothetical protein